MGPLARVMANIFILPEFNDSDEAEQDSEPMSGGRADEASVESDSGSDVILVSDSDSDVILVSGGPSSMPAVVSDPGLDGSAFMDLVARASGGDKTKQAELLQTLKKGLATSKFSANAKREYQILKQCCDDMDGIYVTEVEPENDMYALGAALSARM